MIELSSFLQDESAAQTYLTEKKILREFFVCPFCKSEKIGNIRRDRVRCYKCKKEWHRRKGSFLESRHISYSKFIGLLKLYSSEYNIDQIGDELSLDRKTVAGIISNIQQKILPNYSGLSSDTAILYSKGKRVGLKYLTAGSLVEVNQYIRLEFIRYKEFGSIYSFLINSTRRPGKNNYNVLDRFIGFAKMKLISYRGIEAKYVHQYLFELIIKFNLEGFDYYEYVVKMLHF